MAMGHGYANRLWPMALRNNYLFDERNKIYCRTVLQKCFWMFALSGSFGCRGFRLLCYSASALPVVATHLPQHLHLHVLHRHLVIAPLECQRPMFHHVVLKAQRERDLPE